MDRFIFVVMVVHRSWMWDNSELVRNWSGIHFV